LWSSSTITFITALQQLKDTPFNCHSFSLRSGVVRT